jgi:hypothetical protein
LYAAIVAYDTVRGPPRGISTHDCVADISPMTAGTVSARRSAGLGRRGMGEQYCALRNA